MIAIADGSLDYSPANRPVLDVLREEEIDETCPRCGGPLLLVMLTNLSEAIICMDDAPGGCTYYEPTGF